MTDDEHLLAELGDAVRAADEVPPAFVAAGKAAFAWRTVDTELAALAHDSATSPTAAGTRAGPAARSLSFVAGGLSIEVELTGDTLLGQVVPPQPGQIEMHTVHGSAQVVPVDEAGWFAVRPVTGPMFRLHLRTDAGTVITEWVSR
jgi:hypothetical protein